MAEISGDLGGGGTASSICAISPSDLIGTVDNLITRIEKLEAAVMQLLTANFTANQLSDLSQQVGWVGGVTYMGVPGWTQTEYGSLIPPPGFSLSTNGFTMSDGNVYQAVVMDADGVLQFGFTAEGEVSGASVGATANYIVMNTLSGTPGTNVDFGAVSVVNGSNLSWDSGAPDTITITTAGVYALTFTVNGSTSAADGTIQRFICSVPSGWPFSFTVNELTGVVKSGSFYIGNSLVFIATAATTLKIAWNGSDDPSGVISQGTLVVARI